MDYDLLRKALEDIFAEYKRAHSEYQKHQDISCKLTKESYHIKKDSLESNYHQIKDKKNQKAIDELDLYLNELDNTIANLRALLAREVN